MTFGSRHEPCGVRALVSRDQGQTFDDESAIVFVDNREGRDCGYPTALALPDSYPLVACYRIASNDTYFEGLGGTTITASVKFRESGLLDALHSQKEQFLGC